MLHTGHKITTSDTATIQRVKLHKQLSKDILENEGLYVCHAYTLVTHTLDFFLGSSCEERF